MVISSRIRIPAATGALLWDLDGVILDTLTMEYGVVAELLARHVPGAGPVDREMVRRAFPLPIPDSWRAILGALGAEAGAERVRELTRALEHERTSRSPAVLPGVRELLQGAASAGLAVAVVSNNPVAHVRLLLDRAGLGDIGIVVGDDQGLEPKPAPDMYLAGAGAVGVPPARCVALEDSLIGARAARAAGCFVVGVATGAATFAELEAAPEVDRAYRAFTPSAVRLTPGDVTAKHLDTPNEFVSHMLEHIAWRTGCAIAVDWAGDDWEGLGAAVGAQLDPLLDGPGAIGRALGLIDDGSCEVTLERLADGGEVSLAGAGAVDAARFVAMRCEQLADGRPLVALLEGLARGARLRARIDVAGLEDPHHTWEAIFRATGVALRGLSPTLTARAAGDGDGDAGVPEDARGPAGYGLTVHDASPAHVRVVRTTAETVCTVALALGDAGDGLHLQLATSSSVHSDGLVGLVAGLGRAAGLTGTIDLAALALSSSHVVAEDVGMTLGAALKELATQRMHTAGIEGAGSSLTARPSPIRVGVSFEGRKFLQLVPLGWTREQLRDQLIGGTLSSGLFTEDLDDFLDGLAGGMGASVVVHWEPVPDLDEAWSLVFTGLGTALAALLAPNHAKRGLIAGVKATLA